MTDINGEVAIFCQHLVDIVHGGVFGLRLHLWDCDRHVLVVHCKGEMITVRTACDQLFN